MLKRSDPAPSEDDVERLYEDYGHELQARLYAICCDREVALDAVQESFLRLFEQRSSSIRDLRAWLFRVAKNWLIDAGRQRRRRRLECEMGDPIGLIRGADAEPATILSARETHAHVRAALGKLRHEEREVLVLRYALDWSSLRIADVLAISASAVDMRLLRARRRLAELLERVGVENEAV